MNAVRFKNLKGSPEVGFRWESLRESYFNDRNMVLNAKKAKSLADRYFNWSYSGSNDVDIEPESDAA